MVRPETGDEQGVFGPSTLDVMRQAQKITTDAMRSERAVTTEDRRRVASHIVRQASKGNRSLAGLLKSALKAFVPGKY